MDYLKGNRDHPTAEDIYRAVNKGNPSISLATVYNTLNFLKKKGLVSELSVNSTKRRFDTNNTNHHHFICLSCGNVHDIEEDIGLSIPKALRDQFEILSVRIDLYGRCKGCSGKSQDLPLEGI